MGARWYDPALGRWIQADSIVPEPGNPQALNRFSYVYNNPLRYVDPSGHGPPVPVPTPTPTPRPPFRPLPTPRRPAYYDYAPLSVDVEPHEEYYWAPLPPETPVSLQQPPIGYLIFAIFGLVNAVGGIAIPPGTGASHDMHMPPGQAGLGAGPLGTGELGPPLLPAPPEPAGLLPAPQKPVGILGSLLPEYVAQIQIVVDKTGLPIYVVGGYARGDPHPRKDIDYYIDVEYRKQWTLELRRQLPGQELRRGRCYEACNTEFWWRAGRGRRPPGVHPPYIKFTPGQPPVWVKE